MEGNNDIMSVFYIEEHNNNFLVKANLMETNLPTSEITGSWGVFCARVIGLTYANYLRMCRDVYGAELIGKGKKYPTAQFSSKNNAQKLIKVLTERSDIIKGGEEE